MRMRHGIAELLAVMLVVSFTAASAYYFFGPNSDSRGMTAIGVILTAAGPALLLIAVSLIFAIASRR